MARIGLGEIIPAMDTKMKLLRQETKKEKIKDSEISEAISEIQRQLDDGKPSKAKFNPRPYTEQLLNTHQMKYDNYERFWIYDSETGIWKDKAKLILNAILRQWILGEDDYKRYCVAEILEDIKGWVLVTEDPKEPEPWLIPFHNKVYNLKTDELEDHTPEYFFINKLAISINEEHRECPTIDKILRELVAPDDVITLYEMAAYCLYRGYPYPKLFILHGSGGNGKTVYTKMISRILGEENISLITSNDLQTNRFASSQLFRKFLNVSGEMDYNILKHTSRIKQTCGEDLIYCERKFREPFPFTNYAKLMFLTNQVPLTADKTYAFFRRIFLLEFPHKFVLGETADPMVVQKIPQEEFEGFAWQCLQVLKKLYQNSFVFTNHEKTEEVTKTYEHLSNPLSKFLEEETEKEVNSNIRAADLYEKYEIYQKEHGFRIWSTKEIVKAMREKGFEQKIVRDSENKSTTYRAFIELRWKV